MTTRAALFFALISAAACSGAQAKPPAPLTPPPAPTAVPTSNPLPPPGPPPAGACAASAPLRVHFYDVGQALAALVDLPDGRHVLVDTGDNPARSGCGDVCASKHAALIEKLRADLKGAPIDLVWITHQHSDHVGGASNILRSFKVGLFIDNGRDVNKAEIKVARRAAETGRASVREIDPGHVSAPLKASNDTTVTAVLPPSWPAACTHDANACSILLRIDHCASSVLFTGDAGHEEEALLTSLAPATLLQVGHHGSETSTTPAFLSRVHPQYAVISAGKPNEGMNVDYCHPRASIVERLTKAMGGPGGKTIRSFDGTRCANARPDQWIDAPASDRLWSTSRDGDVTLSTRGDGVFTRE